MPGMPLTTPPGVEPVELDADLPMGVDPEAVHKVQRLRLEPGDRLVLVSDGVLDAAPDGAWRMAPAGLDALLRACGELAPYDVVRRVIREVVAHRAGDLADDLTVVAWTGADREHDGPAGAVAS